MRNFVFALLLTACASSPAPRSPAPPASPPPASPPVAAPPQPPPADQPAPIQIRWGGTPGSNGHRWGTRVLEVRGEPGRQELRIHDEISFQGSNMRPEDMPPPTHACTAWEPLPATIEVPAGMRVCADSPATCDALRAWLTATTPATTPATRPTATPALGPDIYFGRGRGDCAS